MFTSGSGWLYTPLFYVAIFSPAIGDQAVRKSRCARGRCGIVYYFII